MNKELQMFIDSNRELNRNKPLKHTDNKIFNRFSRDTYVGDIINEESGRVEVKSKMFNTFEEDLKKAQQIENAVAEMYRSYGYKVIQAPNEVFPNYDMMVMRGATKTTIEVKSDYLAKDTGNLAIEFENKDGTASGVCAGNMDEYILYTIEQQDFTHKYFIVQKKELYGFAVDNHHRIVNVSQSGNKCMLVRMDKIKNKYKLKPLKLC